MNERLRDEKGHLLSSLTNEQRMEIGKAKAKRVELREQLSQLTNKKLAEKFGVSAITISRTPEYYDRKQANARAKSKYFSGLKAANPWAVL